MVGEKHMYVWDSVVDPVSGGPAPAPAPDLQCETSPKITLFIDFFFINIFNKNKTGYHTQSIG